MTGQRMLRRGFTLIEMVAVVAIIGILIAIVIGGVAGHVSRARVTATKAQISALAQHVDTFFIQQGFYPSSLDDLVTKPAGVSEDNWPQGGYMAYIPADGWGNTLDYQYPVEGNPPYEIKSLGSDGSPGGTGSAKDLSNRDRPE